MTKETIYELITAERDYQDKKWGKEFDHLNTPNDWIAYIFAYAGKAVTLSWNREAFRTAVLKVAALSVAVLERDTYAPHHYDGKNRL